MKAHLLIIILFLLVGCKKQDYDIDINNDQEEVKEIIYVELKGKVSFPGIYELDQLFHTSI